MKRRRLPALIAFFFAVIVAMAAAETAEKKAKYGALVDAPGAALTYGYCTPCHSEQIIAQQGLTREKWDELFVWMIEEHGMAEPPPQLRQQMLDYLSAHYGVDRPNYQNNN